MEQIRAKSPRAARALKLTCHLQQRFVANLEDLSRRVGSGAEFSQIHWGRDEGRHGGGTRFVAPGPNDSLFNRGSVNISQVHYDDEPQKKLASATAISSIIHPQNPHAPSIHIHISWTELKSGRGYWRVMADLNPSIPNPEATAAFRACLQEAAPNCYKEGSEQGDKYFFIPALGRHRGAAHFYLENFNSGDENADYNFARSFGESVVDHYGHLLGSSHSQNTNITDEHREQQLAYHTLYFFQVLTLDRGTTSGLMVHNQNDVGTLGSLPSHIDRDLFGSWVGKLDAPQNLLAKRLHQALPEGPSCQVDDNLKAVLAEVVRAHYTENPEALNMQASGFSLPTTVDNHGNQGTDKNA